jgi:putative nucleotidyltransferase with HDIG domain
MGASILVVDDEAAIRDLFSEWLTLEGHQCVPAASAAEALEAIERQPTDVALLDLRMPGESGVWLARRLREGRDDLAIIMATGAQSFDAAVEGIRIGVMDYLLKPFSRQQLVAAVNRALAWHDSTIRDREERTRLAEEIANRQRELSEAFARLEGVSSGALEALLLALNCRNPDALAHTRRVAQLATATARELGLTGEALATIERGALLHDIGKVAMPDALMNKPGALSEDEIAVIKTHPRIGHDILAAVPGLKPAAEIVLSSHEWYNGAGYPAGLSGADLSLGARIVAVADAYDALTCSRVYRAGVPRDEARAELQRMSGVQFDPEVVQTFLRVVDSPAVEH